LNASKRADTIQRLRIIENALGGYIINNRKLPCPAGIFLTPESNDYGKENCAVNTADGVKESGKILYGTIPVEELKLATKYMIDGWNDKFVYMVIKDYTGIRNNFFSNNISDDDLINSKFVYAIISQGSDRTGAIYCDSNTEISRDIAKATNGEKQNIFSMISGNSIREYRDTDGFDDIVAAKSKETLIQELSIVDGGCTINSSSFTIISSRCGAGYNFTETNSISFGDYLEYKNRKYSNTVDALTGDELQVKRQCVAECGGYGTLSVYLMEVEN
jgi:hypothetical protein